MKYKEQVNFLKDIIIGLSVILLIIFAIEMSVDVKFKDKIHERYLSFQNEVQQKYFQNKKQ